MNSKGIEKLLKAVHDGEVSVEDGLAQLKDLDYTDLGHSRIDNHRELRTGCPEVIYCAGKTVDQIRDIVEHMIGRGSNILGTRATPEMFEAVKGLSDKAEFNSTARTIVVKLNEVEQAETSIAIVCAGTSDLPVAEEAVVTAEFLGNRIDKVFDAGVAGIHRLYGSLDVIKAARVVVVVAGMEGALPSVVGGLVDVPVIAVPTSVGYGACFEGLSALLGMLTSCASGITVVNIDNGFGAGYAASMINRL